MPRIDFYFSELDKNIPAARNLLMSFPMAIRIRRVNRELAKYGAVLGKAQQYRVKRKEFSDYIVTYYYPAEFSDSSQYLMFLLRWS